MLALQRGKLAQHLPPPLGALEMERVRRAVPPTRLSEGKSQSGPEEGVGGGAQGVRKVMEGERPWEWAWQWVLVLESGPGVLTPSAKPVSLAGPAVSKEWDQKDVLLTEASPGPGVLPEAPVPFSVGADFLVLEGAKGHRWLTRKWLHSSVPPQPSPE